MKRLDLFPVTIVEDRYGGAYSGGAWIAVAHSDCLDGPTEDENISMTRIAFVLGEDGSQPGPSDGDPDAMIFWRNPPDWLAVGDSPDRALAALKEKLLVEA